MLRRPLPRTNRGAKQILETADMRAECGLSPVEPVRRLREAAGVDHAHKALQQNRIDGAHGNILISDVIDAKYYIF